MGNKRVEDRAGYENLANAIILQAVEDYEKALGVLYTKDVSLPIVFNAKNTKSNCEAFFGSKWYQKLTHIDSRIITERTKRLVYAAGKLEYNEEQKRYVCICNYPVPKNAIKNKKVPVYKCPSCGRYIRVWGKVKLKSELQEEGLYEIKGKVERLL